MLPTNDDSHLLLKEKFTITVDGKPAGFINWNGYQSDSTTAGLYSFYIEPEYRDKGYGSRLMQFTLDYLARHGYTSVLLIPGPQEMVNGQLTQLDEGPNRDQAMERLLKFYRRHGFVTDPNISTQMITYLTPPTQSTSTKPYLVLLGAGAVGLLMYVVLRKFFKYLKKN
jgi:GNAT superfamily N-acetyltransferase